MIQAARQQTASTARTPDADVRSSPAAPTVAGRGALPAGLSGAGAPPSRWSLGAPNAAAEREAETAADRIGQGLRAGPLSAGGGASEVRGDGATAAAGPIPQPAARALDGLSSGGGRPLSAPQMAFFGEAFSGPGRSPDTVQKSLAPVRVHTDTRASTVLEHTGAAAANVGSNVMSRPSDYSADRPDGGPHFPHEIAHALQPGGQAGDGVVRRVIQDKNGSNVNRPVWKSLQLPAGQMKEIKAIYATLLNLDTTYKFKNKTNQQIKAYITDYVSSGKKSVDFLTYAQSELQTNALYSGPLSSTRLSKTDSHDRNFQNYAEMHIDYMLQLEKSTATPSSTLKNLVTAEQAARNAELAEADSRVATGLSIKKVTDRLNAYYGTLNTVLTADGQPARRVNVALPSFDQFANTEEMGLQTSLSVNPYSSLAKGSSSRKDNVSTRAKWEDYLDSRTYDGSVLYVRGHLLNANLSGPELPINLVPLVYKPQQMGHSANDVHSALAEEGVKLAATNLLEKRDQQATADQVDLHDELGEIEYSVKANYSKPADDSRAQLRQKALHGVLEAGKMVSDEVKKAAALAATPSAPVPLPDPKRPDEIAGALSKLKLKLSGRESSALNAALISVNAKDNASGLAQYQLLLENAGLWDYDYEFVPRSLTITKAQSVYNYDDDTRQLTAVRKLLQPETISNEINSHLRQYGYVRKTKSAALIGRTKTALQTMPSSASPGAAAASPKPAALPPPQSTSLQRASSQSPPSVLQSQSNSSHTPVGATSFSSPKPPALPQQQPQQSPTGALAGLGAGLPVGNGTGGLRFDQMDASGNAITPQYYTQAFTQKPPNVGGGAPSPATRTVSTLSKPTASHAPSPLPIPGAPPPSGGASGTLYNPTSLPPAPSPLLSQTQTFTGGTSSGSTPSLDPYGLLGLFPQNPQLQLQIMLANLSSYQALQPLQTQFQPPPPSQTAQFSPTASLTPTARPQQLTVPPLVGQPVLSPAPLQTLQPQPRPPAPMRPVPIASSNPFLTVPTTAAASLNLGSANASTPNLSALPQAVTSPTRAVKKLEKRKREDGDDAYSDVDESLEERLARQQQELVLQRLAYETLQRRVAQTQHEVQTQRLWAAAHAAHAAQATQAPQGVQPADGSPTSTKIRKTDDGGKTPGGTDQ